MDPQTQQAQVVQPTPSNMSSSMTPSQQMALVNALMQGQQSGNPYGAVTGLLSAYLMSKAPQAAPKTFSAMTQAGNPGLQQAVAATEDA